MRTTHSLLMDARTSELAVMAWCAVAAIVAMARPLGAVRRWRVIGGASGLALMTLATTRIPDHGVAGMARNLAPAVFVLCAYWLAGGYFIAPLQLERRLTTGPRWLLEVLEAAYFSVYALLPIGAWAAWARGGPANVDTYWTIVFLSESSCYVALAWLQTRPPRMLEPWAASIRARSRFRRANEAVLTRGSHHMNTIPSGHAAGAVAVALAVWTLQAPGAWMFGVVAAGICVATVVGRYHFVVDTVAGVVVAAGWWWVVTAVRR